jgi:hypothetical protein
VGGVGELLVTNYVLFIPDTRRAYEMCARVLIGIQYSIYVRGYAYTCDFVYLVWTVLIGSELGDGSACLGTWRLLLLPNRDHATVST